MQPLFTFHVNVSKRQSRRNLQNASLQKYTPGDKKVECTGTPERSLNKGERNADCLTPASATGSA